MSSGEASGGTASPEVRLRRHRRSPVMSTSTALIAAPPPPPPSERRDIPGHLAACLSSLDSLLSKSVTYSLYLTPHGAFLLLLSQTLSKQPALTGRDSSVGVVGDRRLPNVLRRQIMT